MHETTKTFLRSLAIDLSVFAGIGILLFVFVGRAYGIPSGSMENTLEIGDKLFVEHATYYFESPQQGDIVTFRDPEGEDRTLIKRVIATEGQTVDLVDGAVVVDGVILDEPYTRGLPSYPMKNGDVSIMYPIEIPEGHVWLMGDNRTKSADSRVFGPVPTNLVTGKAVFRTWPIGRFGLIE